MSDARVIAAVRTDLERSEAARAAQAKAMLDFNTALLAGDWDGAEESRKRAIGHFEAYLDHMMQAHRAIREK